MPKIIYYVASSLDGFIAGPNDNISYFVAGGKGVEKYLSDLQKFKTVIMGRRTYELVFNMDSNRANLLTQIWNTIFSRILLKLRNWLIQFTLKKSQLTE